ncbi:MAG: hypothetical protein HZA62_16355 [Rhodocyclales bacterium]|nr:hypothetical protein [Rhodocyclales bacterium]
METKSTCPYCGVGCGPQQTRGPRAAGVGTPLSSPRRAGGSTAARFETRYPS